MIRTLVAFALDNPIVVVLGAVGLAFFGFFAFLHVNVEAYPDPAPPIVEIVAPYNGASAEEIERQVTVPLEVTFAGMPGLKFSRSKSLFGLSHLRLQFDYETPYKEARQEVINRLQFTQQLPPGVTPQISPESPTGEIFRYTLDGPKDLYGNEIYTLNDLKALQDWVLEREFRRVPRIVDVSSSGGMVRRYEIHPDPDRLRLYGVTLGQLQSALQNANITVGGDNISQGTISLSVRGVSLISGGEDPVRKVIGLKDPDPVAAETLRQAESEKADPIELAILRESQRRRIALLAGSILRAEEMRRVQEIRQIVITSINNQPIRIDDIVEGGRLLAGSTPGEKGVVVGNQTRLGKVGYTRHFHTRDLLDGSMETSPHAIRNTEGQIVGEDEPDRIQCIVLLRKGEDSLPALNDLKVKVKELNSPDSTRMLPGVKIDTYYDRTELINVTTETVRENLVMGILLVTLILFMFISNVRAALIVAINIPLALLFAFSVLYLRGKSANLLSIGAVDFGIIVDSSVIMVENIYRSISEGEHAELSLKERILKSSGDISRALLFSTLIMICAFIPLFTMRGPEGQLFGPMADTYAFSLGGALLMAVTLAPVLCMLFFKGLKPAPDNFLVRYLKNGYLNQLRTCLVYRYTTLLFMASLIGITVVMVVKNKPDGTPYLGREFMPELEEGNLWIRGMTPLNANLERVAAVSREARAIMISYPEVETVVNQVGRPDDGTDPSGFYNSEFFVPLKPHKSWPKLLDQTGWISWIYGPKRSRTKLELVSQMNAELQVKLPGIDWNFSQNIRDNVMESMSGVKGDNSVKIFGPDLETLQEVAGRVKNVLEKIPGIVNVGIFDVRGQSNLEFRVDPEKCARWGVSPADVTNVIASALGGKAMNTMIEGEKFFDISVRWPAWRRSSETSILDIPVDVTNNQVVLSQGPSLTPNAFGTSQVGPATVGSKADTSNPLSTTPRLRLRDLVSPVGPDGTIDPTGPYLRGGASTIYREQGNRLIAIKFSVRGRDLGGAVDQARVETKDLFQSPYRAVWSGEFEEMEEAEARLMLIIPISLGLIFILLYMAFRSVIDSMVVFSNVLALTVGGIWALVLTGTNFSISAAVGFVSLFGVAIMDGLLLISSFNALRAHGMPVTEAILQGASKRVRPVTMTALTAILGLLPTALSTRIGSQTQRPLALVVVGGMIMTLALTRYLMPLLYSFYGHREPPEGSGDMAH